MKCLSIQLHPDRDTSFRPEDLIQHLKSIGRYPEIDIDQDKPQYVNLNLFTEDLNALSQQINTQVIDDEHLGPWVKNVSVIVCEGDQGWDDYILLWHYDKDELADDASK